MLYYQIIFLVSCIFAMNTSEYNATRDVDSAGTSSSSLIADKNKLKSSGCSNPCSSTKPNQANKSGVLKSKPSNDSETSQIKPSPKSSPLLGARKKITSSLSAIKRGASALSTSVNDLTKATNATISERLLQSPKSSKRPSLKDFQTKLTKKLNAPFKSTPNIDSTSKSGVAQIPQPRSKSVKLNAQRCKTSAPALSATTRSSSVDCTSKSSNVTSKPQTNNVVYRKVDGLKKTSTKTKDDNNTTKNQERKEVVSLPTDFNYGTPPSPQHRVTPGRSANRDIKSDTELYGSVHLKAVLNVLRSNITPEEKLIAIKKSKDYWDKIGSVTEEIPCLPQERDKDKMGTTVTPGNLELDELQSSQELLRPTTISSNNPPPPILIQSSSCDVTDEVVTQEGSMIHVTKITLSPDTSETEQCISSIVQQVSLEVNPGIMVDGLDDGYQNNRPLPVNFRSPKNSLILNIDSDDLPLSQCSQPPKSPVTVQEWVNSIDVDGGEERTEVESAQAPEHSSVSHDSGYQSHGDVLPSFMEDNLNLGAEARNIDGVVDSSIPEIPSPAQRKESLSPAGHHVSLADIRMKQSSFNSETSTFSTVSSLSSVESLLESRKEDPEEILLALGFGATSQDPLARIPHRFLSQPSSARGVDLVTFLRQQEEEFQKQECSCLGYRGLAAMSPSDNKQPSAIANKIIEKLGETRSTGNQSRTGSISSSIMSPVTSKPRSFASAVIAATAFKHGKVLKRSDSILDPANREFLMKQGADNNSLKHKKVILGSHTFKFDPEGGLVQTSPENSTTNSSPSTPPNETESPQARSQRLKEVFQRLHKERTLREQEEKERKLLKSNHSMVERTDTPHIDDKMHLSLQEPTDLEKKNRPLLVRQLKIEDCVHAEDGSNKSNTTTSNKTLTPDCLKGQLEAKESFELEEITMGEHGSSSTTFRSPLTVEGSLSESSGFEDGHLCSPPGKFEHTSQDSEDITPINSCGVIPPVEITSWHSASADQAETEKTSLSSSPPPSPNFSQRSRYSDPSISLYSLQLPNEQGASGSNNQLSPTSSSLSMSRNSSSGTITDGNNSSNSSVSHFEKHNLRKGSYPQPSARKWAPLVGGNLPRHFQWTMTDQMSKRLSSSQTTLTNCDSIPSENSGPTRNSSTCTIDAEFSKNASCQVSNEDIDDEGTRNNYTRRRATWCTTPSNPPQSLLAQNIAFAKDDAVAQNQALVELQSMKLSLEQYRLQSQQLESSSLRFLRLYPLLSADQISSLESVHRLRLDIFREIGRMEELLSQHINLVKVNSPSDYHVLNFRFSHAIEQMSNLLRDQGALCKQLDDISSVTEDKTGKSPKMFEGNEANDQNIVDFMVNELSLLRQQLQIDQQSQHLKFQQLIQELTSKLHSILPTASAHSTATAYDGS